MKTIEITVTPEGSTSVETRGYSGVSCRDASRFIESALGQKTDEQMTPAYHETNNQITQNTEEEQA
jgi:hypothetical protein